MNKTPLLLLAPVAGALTLSWACADPAPERAAAAPPEAIDMFLARQLADEHLNLSEDEAEAAEIDSKAGPITRAPLERSEQMVGVVLGRIN